MLRNSRGKRVSADAYKREVLEAVSARLDRQLSGHTHPSARRNQERVTALDQLRSDELADLLVAGLPVIDTDNELAGLVGPCYLTGGVQTLLGSRRGQPVSKQAVDDRRRRGAILALHTADDRWVYPTWQFADGEVRSDVARLLAVFGDTPRWSVAAWFRTPAATLGGRTPLQWLDRGAAQEDVVRLAGQTAARWAA